MSFQEKENYVNIISSLLISSIFAWIIYQRHMAGQFDLTTDFSKWGVVFLIFIGVSIAARIIIYILFYIGNTIAMKEEEKAIEDERVKLIKLKSSRNSYHAFSGTFVIAFILLAVGMPVWGIFVAFVVSGVLSELVDNFSQIYYNRKGI
jgi:uncharacterized membrane protein